MKILFISGNAPAKFNTGEPNAYPFYLIKELATRHSVHVLYFNENLKLKSADINNALLSENVVSAKEINPEHSMKFVRLGIYFTRVFILKILLAVRLPVPSFIPPLPRVTFRKKANKKVVDEIEMIRPDLVIAFPIQIYHSLKPVSARKIPLSILATDSPSLHYRRQMAVWQRVSTSLSKSKQLFYQSRSLEKLSGRLNSNFFFVGEDDKRNFIETTHLAHRCHFLKHHLYSSTLPSKANWEGSSVLNILFAGGRSIYTGDEVEMIANSISNSSLSKNNFRFLFLGSGYDESISVLMNNGFTCEKIQWVENYDTFMQQIHVQIFPIILGTGTKAKVLSAITSEVYCIGTNYAFENIQIDNNLVSLYNFADEIPSILESISKQKELYSQLVTQARNQVLKNHNTSEIANELITNFRIPNNE